MNRLKYWRLVGLVTVVLLSGCVVAPVPDGSVVYQEPPPSRAEVVGVAPGPAYVWIGGYWIWRDRWEWHHGRWARRPHRGASWAPGRWHHHGNGWRWSPGHWRR